MKGYIQSALVAVCALTAVAFTTVPARAQQVAVKSNLLSDVVLTPNVGVEFAIARRLTLDVTGEFNAWRLSHDRRWKHWSVQPEVRWWLCDRFSGHFLAAHLQGGLYNLGAFNGRLHLFGSDARRLTDYRYQGWFAGGGVAYGYDWILNRHLNLEAEIGFGYSYTRYDRFRCTGCGAVEETDKAHHYVGPTKAAVNLVYTF